MSFLPDDDAFYQVTCVFIVRARPDFEENIREVLQAWKTMTDDNFLGTNANFGANQQTSPFPNSLWSR